MVFFKKIILLFFCIVLSSFSFAEKTEWEMMQDYASQNNDTLYVLTDSENLTLSFFNKKRFEKEIFSEYYKNNDVGFFVIYGNNSLMKKECLAFLYVYTTEYCHYNNTFKDIFYTAFSKHIKDIDNNFEIVFNNFIIIHEFGHYIALKNNFFEKENNVMLKKQDEELFSDIFALEVLYSFYGIDFRKEVKNFRELNVNYKGDSFYNYSESLEKYNFYEGDFSISKIKTKIHKFVITQENRETNEYLINKDFFGEIALKSMEKSKNDKILYKALKDYRNYIDKGNFARQNN